MALATNLVSYWNLDETSGTRHDAYGSNNLAIYNTVNSFSDPTMGNVASFPGNVANALWISDASQVGLDLTTAFTLNAWAKAPLSSNNNGGGVLMSKWYHSVYNQYEYYLADTGTLVLGTDSTPSGYGYTFTSSTTGVVTANAWHMLTVTYTGSSVSFYVDGVFISSGAAQTPSNSLADFALGLEKGRDLYWYNGYMSRAGVWSRVLTSTEITQLYNGGAGMKYPFPTYTPIPMLAQQFM